MATNFYSTALQQRGAEALRAVFGAEVAEGDSLRSPDRVVLGRGRDKNSREKEREKERKRELAPLRRRPRDRGGGEEEERGHGIGRGGGGDRGVREVSRGRRARESYLARQLSTSPYPDEQVMLSPPPLPPSLPSSLSRSYLARQVSTSPYPDEQV